MVVLRIEKNVVRRQEKLNFSAKIVRLWSATSEKNYQGGKLLTIVIIIIILIINNLQQNGLEDFIEHCQAQERVISKQNKFTS